MSARRSRYVKRKFAASGRFMKIDRLSTKLVFINEFSTNYTDLEPAVNRQPGFRRGAVEQTRPPSAREQTREPTNKPRTDRKSHRSRGILLSWWVAGLKLGGLVAWWLRGSVARWLGGLWFGRSTARSYTPRRLDDSMA